MFFSVYPAHALPAMTVAAAGASLLFALGAAWWLTRAGPARLVPVGFFASGMLVLAEWRLIGPATPLVAVLFYLHYTAFGAMLVSGLWSIVAERFDPRATRREVGRIGGAGTLGGVLGGLVAVRAGATLDVAVMLPVLAACHLLAGVCASVAGRGIVASGRAGEPEAPLPALLATRRPYLRLLLALVLLTTLAEVMLDYVFKARVTDVLGDGSATAGNRSGALLQFFAWFYTGTGILAFAVQVLWSRPFLRKLGLGRTVGALPVATAVGSVGALASGGFAPLVGARAGEAVTRFGLYRSGYELLFAPLMPREKRATKSLLDVGVTRLGDIVGSVVVRMTLLSTSAMPLLLGLAAVLSGIAAALSVRLQRGYAAALEGTLTAQAGLPEGVEDDAFQSAMLHTWSPSGTIELVRAERRPPESAADAPVKPVDAHGELRSRDAGRVRRALRAGAATGDVLPDVIRLLAWDVVARDAAAALRDVAPTAASRLVAALLDPDEEFAVRRRLPSVLARVPTQAVADGLAAGLADPRFEVRYRCGLALHRIRGQAPALRIDDATVIGAVLREVNVDRGVWESHRVLDRQEDEEWSPMFDEVLRDRASRALQHVFTMLALVLPREPLQLAFRGLHTRDPQVRGTALEYLEVTLPKNVRVALWPFLEDTRTVAPTPRSRDEVLRDLLASQATIALDLRRLRRGSADG